MYFVIFCTIFMIIGFVDFIRFISNILFIKSKNKIKNSNDAEFVIRNLVNRNLWNQNCSKLICVDSDDVETEKIINIAKQDFEFINFLPNREFEKEKNKKVEKYSN